MIKGLIGKKIGMTKIFNDKFEMVVTTVVEAGPCFVVSKKTKTTQNQKVKHLPKEPGQQLVNVVFWYRVVIDTNTKGYRLSLRRKAQRYARSSMGSTVFRLPTCSYIHKCKECTRNNLSITADTSPLTAISPLQSRHRENLQAGNSRATLIS